MRIECEAMLFDLDGVLVESLPLIERILRTWAAGYGLDADRAVELSHGRREADLIRLLAPEMDAEAGAAEIIAVEEREFTGLEPVAGAPELLAALPAGRWAVVTSGTRLVAEGRLAAAGLPRPDVFLTAEDTPRGKPDPEGYLKAAAMLGYAPDQCVVVEDAPAGLAAAAAAGMASIGRGGQARQASMWVPDLTGLSLTVSAAGLSIGYAQS
ncbi:HAD-IA family hydrolase [Longispora albida]|uniref:HAD-IA family hydrolase n=1 Tax=Longispora albida TaxID=203523 RepID=UPI00037432C2|nr:HAD-IA family hydrolase [Longispora albida]